MLQEKQQEVEHELRLLQAEGEPRAQRRAYQVVTDRLVKLKTRL